MNEISSYRVVVGTTEFDVEIGARKYPREIEVVSKVGDLEV